MKITDISGGVTAPKGFMAGGFCCGIKPENTTKKDVALIYSEKPCVASGMFTQNLVQASPVTLTREKLKSGVAQGIIANSGNANCCNADGMEKAEKMARLAADIMNINTEDVLVASTGVIGQILPFEPFVRNRESLKACIIKDGSKAAAESIMTTDTVPKECAVETQIGGQKVHIGGIAKGSGMIHINMGTMLSFVTTDVSISRQMLDKAVKEAVEDTFNMVSVDGDTSTNDTFIVLANGMAENAEITKQNEDYALFLSALKKLCKTLAKALAGDGEGATKLLICDTFGANDKKTARMIAKSVVCSSLVKTAIFGADANWGRVLCAIGYSGASTDIKKVDVSFVSAKGEIPVCKNGAGIPFSEEKAKEILLEKEITISVNLNSGSERAEAFGCDLTYDYVKINGDYRT